jgi:hypothetical protein
VHLQIALGTQGREDLAPQGPVVAFRLGQGEDFQLVPAVDDPQALAAVIQLVLEADTQRAQEVACLLVPVVVCLLGPAGGCLRDLVVGSQLAPAILGDEYQRINLLDLASYC